MNFADSTSKGKVVAECRIKLTLQRLIRNFAGVLTVDRRGKGSIVPFAETIAGKVSGANRKALRSRKAVMEVISGQHRVLSISEISAFRKGIALAKSPKKSRQIDGFCFGIIKSFGLRPRSDKGKALQSI